MKELKFTTNINCGGCIATVTPFLNQIQDITWEVDTGAKDKILTVRGTAIDEQAVVEKVKEAGFQINAKKGLLGKFF